MAADGTSSETRSAGEANKDCFEQQTDKQFLQLKVADAETWPARVARDMVCPVDLYIFAFSYSPAPCCGQWVMGKA